MLYNLLYPLSVDYSILNIFKYITFRSAWALVTALAVSILVGPYFKTGISPSTKYSFIKWGSNSGPTPFNTIP